MANDDLVRIVYRSKRMSDQGASGKAAGAAAGTFRRSRTSVSMIRTSTARSSSSLVTRAMRARSCAAGPQRSMASAAARRKPLASLVWNTRGCSRASGRWLRLA